MIAEFNKILVNNLESIEKRKGENNKQFKGFIQYCEIRLNEDRTNMGYIAESAGVSLKTVYNWSSKYDWKSRYERFYDKTLEDFMEYIGKESVISNNSSLTKLNKFNDILWSYDLEFLFRRYSNDDDFNITKWLYLAKEIENLKKMQFKTIYGNKFEELGLVGIQEEQKNKQQSNEEAFDIDELNNITAALTSIDKNKELMDIQSIVEEQKRKAEEIKRKKEEEEEEEGRGD